MTTHSTYVISGGKGRPHPASQEQQQILPRHSSRACQLMGRSVLNNNDAEPKLTVAVTLKHNTEVTEGQ